MKLEPKSKTKPVLMWQAQSHNMYTDTGKKQQGHVKATRPLKTVSTRGNMSRQQIFLCVNFSLGLCYLSMTWEAWWSNGIWKERLRNDPRAGHCVVLLGKAIYLIMTLSILVYKWVTLKFILAVTLRWTSILFREEQKYSQMFHATETGISSVLMRHWVRKQKEKNITVTVKLFFFCFLIFFSALTLRLNGLSQKNTKVLRPHLFGRTVCRNFVIM